MDNVEILLVTLEPEINKKCMELRQKKHEKAMAAVFLLLAGVMLVVPAFLVFVGVKLITIFIPIIFTAVCLLALSPLLISKGAVLNE